MPSWIRIWIQPTKINADPDPNSNPKHCIKPMLQLILMYLDIPCFHLSFRRGIRSIVHHTQVIRYNSLGPAQCIKYRYCGGAVYNILFSSYVFYCGASETLNLFIVCGRGNTPICFDLIYASSFRE